jgi:hypothetical protein
VKLRLHFIWPILLTVLFGLCFSQHLTASGASLPSLSLPIFGSPRLASTEPNIICEDGEKFVLKEKSFIEALNSPLDKKDYIVIDTGKLKLTLYHEGKAIKSYPVAIGEPETPSPIGEWIVIHNGGNWGNGFGVRWIGLDVPWGIYGIHGTNKPWTIGTRASHGCIRMFNKNVLELYDLVKLGMLVKITGFLPKVNPRKEVGPGNTGRDIIAMQFALRNAGFDPGRIDGRFGELMEAAVHRFQFYYGLAPTGKLSGAEQYLLNLR